MGRSPTLSPYDSNQFRSSSLSSPGRPRRSVCIRLLDDRPESAFVGFDLCGDGFPQDLHGAAFLAELLDDRPDRPVEQLRRHIGRDAGNVVVRHPLDQRPHPGPAELRQVPAQLVSRLFEAPLQGRQDGQALGDHRVRPVASHQARPVDPERLGHDVRHERPLTAPARQDHPADPVGGHALLGEPVRQRRAEPVDQVHRPLPLEDLARTGRPCSPCGARRSGWADTAGPDPGSRTSPCPRRLP